MTREEAFNQIGVKKGASKAEVKKAFRKKAKNVHPDVNDSKDAHHKFIKLTEAYDVLINNKATPPQAGHTSPTKQTQPANPFVKYANVYTAPTDPQEYKEWLKVAKERAKQVAKEEYRRIEQEIITFRKIGNWLAIIGGISLVIGLFCGYDLFFTDIRHTEYIETIDVDIDGYMITTDTRNYRIGLDDLQSVQQFDDSVHISQSEILGVYKKINFYADGDRLEYLYYNDIYYSHFVGIIFGTLIGICALLFRKKMNATIVSISIFGILAQYGSLIAVLAVS